jgi:DNA polymerase-3 subunit delta'
MRTEEAFEQIHRAAQSGRLAQAYLIIGPPEGAGIVLAEQILRMLFCANDLEGCGKCRGCVQVCKRSHSDIEYIEAEKKSRIISVDQIRQLRERMARSSYVGGWKAGVVIAADRLGSQAANAFLKTLEEPTEKTIFLLLTGNPSSLLPTIVSRCQRIVLHEGGGELPEEMRQELVDILISREGGGDEQNTTGAIAAFGFASRIIGLLRNVKEAAGEREKKKAAESGLEIDEKIMDARAGAKYRGIRNQVLQFIMDWHRDVAILAGGGPDEVVKNFDHLDVLRAQARALGRSRAMREIEMVEKMNRELEGNLPEETVLGFGIARMFGRG